MQRRIEASLFDLGRVVIDLDQARAHARWAELARVPMRDLATSSCRFAKSTSPTKSGRASPSRRPFAPWWRTWDSRPSACFFFDDSAENVAGARACGLMAVEVTTAAQIEAALGDFGVRAVAGQPP
jgi:hypothetical protein